MTECSICHGSLEHIQFRVEEIHRGLFIGKVCSWTCLRDLADCEVKFEQHRTNNGFGPAMLDQLRPGEPLSYFGEK